MKINQQLKNQYDSLYASKAVVFGEGKPIKSVCKIGDYINTGTVLDIGGGEGRNALYLAEQGFSVTVVDLSSVGIEKLEMAAEERGLYIQTEVSDVLVDGIKGKYDVIIISFVLHHINEDAAEKLIKEAQIHTTTEGINIITTFMNEGGLYDRSKKANRFYPSESVLKNLYADWDIKELSSHKATTHARNKEGERMKNQVVTLTAKKR